MAGHLALTRFVVQWLSWLQPMMDRSMAEARHLVVPMDEWKLDRRPLV